MKQNLKKILNLAFLLSLSAVLPVQAAPLPDGTRLTITPGVTDRFGQCVSGSCIEIIGVASSRMMPLNPGTDGGIIIGKNQRSGGHEQEDGRQASSEIIAQRQESLTSGRYFTFTTSFAYGSKRSLAAVGADLNIFDDQLCNGRGCIGKTELGALTLVIDGAVIKFGSKGNFGSEVGCNLNTDNPSAFPLVRPCNNDERNGALVSNWTVFPDNRYALHYSQVSSTGQSQFDPSLAGFGGRRINLILRGNIERPKQFSEAKLSAKEPNFANTKDELGGGAAWIDANNDGYPELFITNSGGQNWFYHNSPDRSTSVPATGIVDRIFLESDYLGRFLSGPAGQSRGAVVGDYDGDGCDDLYVLKGQDISGIRGFVSDVPGEVIRNIFGTRGGEKNTLYRNTFCDTGRIGFEDVTEAAGLAGESEQSIAAAFGDINQDGYLDLYVGNFMFNGNGAFSEFVGSCAENNFYLNSGDGSFAEVAASVGVDDNGCTLAVTMTDFDQDGDLDIYVVNDFSPGSIRAISRTSGSDALYENTGTLNGLPQFSLATANITDANNGMGIATGDYDNDLDLDYYATTISISRNSSDVLNQNQSDGTFVSQAESAGLNKGFDINSNPLSISWGTAFFDMDNDGYLDLYKANGAVAALFGLSATQPNKLFHNNQDGTFTDVALEKGVDGSRCPNAEFFCNGRGPSDSISLQGGVAGFDQSRGVALADYDLDGDVDMLVTNVGLYSQVDPITGGVVLGEQKLLEYGTNRLYRNNLDNEAARSVRVILEGNRKNHRGIGAKVILRTSDGMQQMREVQAGSSHASSHAFPVHFGLGQREIVSIEVQWPAGCVSTFLATGSPFKQLTVREAECKL